MSDPRAYYRTALALNNMAISLMQRQCYCQAVEVLQAANEMMNVHLMTRANEHLARANHYLARWRLYINGDGNSVGVESSLDSSRSAHHQNDHNQLRVIADTEILNVMRTDFQEDLLEAEMPFKCFLIQFTENFDLQTPWAYQSLTATLLNNLASAVMISRSNVHVTSLPRRHAASAGSEYIAQAHELWCLSSAHLDLILYRDRDEHESSTEPEQQQQSQPEQQIQTTPQNHGHHSSGPESPANSDSEGQDDVSLTNGVSVNGYFCMELRALLVLILRCMAYTASVLKWDADSRAFSTAMMDEFFQFHEADIQGNQQHVGKGLAAAA